MGLKASALYSTVKNTSGKARSFGQLPPHGRTLAANQEFTVYGDVREAMIRNDRPEARRSILALERDLSEDRLSIVQTPSPIVLDAVTGTPSILQVVDGILGVTDAAAPAESPS